MGKIICHRTVKFRQRGEEGNGFKAVVYRDSVFNEAQWNAFGTVGHPDTWSNTSATRNGCRIGDLFQIIGKATDTNNSHTLTYRCTNSSGDLAGTCIAHQMVPAGISLGENIIDNSLPAHTKTISGNSGSYYYDSDKTYEVSNMPAVGTKVSAQARVKLTNCSYSSEFRIIVYIQCVLNNSGVAWLHLTDFYPTGNGTFDQKREAITIPPKAGGEWSGKIHVRIDGLTSGTVSIERVKLEVGEKCSVWSLSENDKKGEKGADATGGYVLTGEWKPNTQYAYNTERRDVVLVNGVKKRVKNRGTFTSRSSFDSTEAAYWEDATNVPFASMELILVDVAFIEKLIATRLQTGISMTPRINISGNEMQIFSKFSDSDGNEVPAMRTTIDESGAVHFRFMNPNTGVESDLSYKGFSMARVTETPNEFSLLGNFIRSTSASDTFAALCSSWRTSSIPLYTVKSGYQTVNGQLQPILDSSYESKVYLTKRTTDPARQGTYYEFFHQSYGSKLYIGYIVTVASDGTYSRYKFYHNSDGNRALISNFSGHDFTYAEASDQVAQDFSKQDMLQEELVYDDQVVLSGYH